MNKVWKTGLTLALLVTALAGCVNQHPSGRADTTVAMNRREGKEEQGERIISGSIALCEIFDRLQINLVGVPETKLGQLPQRYADTPTIGMPMNPDLERVAGLQPTIVYAPDSLTDWLKTGYEKNNIPCTFLNLRSVDGLYQTIHTLASAYGKQKEEEALLKEKEEFMAQIAARLNGKEKKRTLILMGLPGSYVAATPKSYVGSLLALAGGENVVPAEHDEEFRQMNTEALLQLDPDVILRTAHAVPEQVQEMFQKEFSENDIWKHFRAVQEQKVYDLPADSCGMSARFNYRTGVEAIIKALYGLTEE
ncbi:MAG: heme ABC transporter substrate-binding protein IsdE [Lachnospiraceae bacterium]|nr:heme ABC transporter substrate-binding protein IsdE [Lachnospiraceae bacterium]MDY5741439.1 heme ABC transporter substrate-binding protein IsdE [Lachnospiraceae bacterium]